VIQNIWTIYTASNGPNHIPNSPLKHPASHQSDAKPNSKTKLWSQKLPNHGRPSKPRRRRSARRPCPRPPSHAAKRPCRLSHAAALPSRPQCRPASRQQCHHVGRPQSRPAGLPTPPPSWQGVLLTQPCDLSSLAVLARCRRSQRCYSPTIPGEAAGVAPLTRGLPPRLLLQPVPLPILSILRRLGHPPPPTSHTRIRRRQPVRVSHVTSKVLTSSTSWRDDNLVPTGPCQELPKLVLPHFGCVKIISYSFSHCFEIFQLLTRQ
jgi:hypothetical protein